MRTTPASPHLTWVLLLSSVVPLASACDGGLGYRGRHPTPGDGGTSTSRADAAIARPTDSGPPAFEECASVTVEATTRARPTDIVWVIDSSGSMDNEAARVQDNLNLFAAGVIEAGIDPHVVVVTSSDFVNVPPPLGTDAEHYLFVDQHVGSHEPLEQLLDQLDRYAPFLRSDAALHFVAVTDDESDLSSSEFDAAIRSRIGRDYVLHAIASESSGFGWPCSGAADVGEQYYELAERTGGQQISICTSDWEGVFMRLLEAVDEAAPLPCALDLPEPPEGSTLDTTRVNVLYQPGTGGTGSPIPFVGSAGACGASGGWHYDDPAAPTSIVLCTTSCEAVAADTTGRLDVALGCETILL